MTVIIHTCPTCGHSVKSKRCAMCRCMKPLKDFLEQTLNSDGKSCYCALCDLSYIAQLKQLSSQEDEEMIDDSVLVLIEESSGRGVTCHELAQKLAKHPRIIGRALNRLQSKLDHLKSERNGQKVIIKKTGEQANER